MEKPPSITETQESKEATRNPNSIFEWGMMPSNTDVPTTSDNVYRSVKAEALDDLEASGVVRNAGSAGVGSVRKYGDRVYWTRGKDGEFHNVQPGHVVLEAPLAIASSRIVTKDDLVGIHRRSEAGEIENAVSQMKKLAADNLEQEENSEQLADVRRRLGLSNDE